MNKEMKAKRILKTVLAFGLIFVLLCMSMGCNGTCFGCNIACQSDENLSVSGIENESKGCFNSQKSCISVTARGEFEDNSKDFIISCYESEDEGCCGRNVSYKGCYTSGCTSCEIFSGHSDGEESVEKGWGCVDGVLTCGGSTNGMFRSMLIGIFGILGF